MRYNEQEHWDGVVSYNFRGPKGIYFRVTYEGILVWERFEKFVKPTSRRKNYGYLRMHDAMNEQNAVVRDLEG